MNHHHEYNVLSVDSTLLLLKNRRDDHYLSWLLHTDFPPISYLEHPLKSEKELNDYKYFFTKNFKISLDTFIQIKRVFFILHNTQYKPNNDLSYSFIETPIGLMLAIFSKKGLCLLEFLDTKMLETEINALIQHFQSNLVFNQTERHIELQTQINHYFQNKRKNFNIPLDMVGTDFQLKVWNELIKIDYGKTISYLQQSINLSMPNATRAVASANGKNKISILVPCHRVLRKGGDLGGYSGGIYRKKYLIDLENQPLQPNLC